MLPHFWVRDSLTRFFTNLFSPYLFAFSSIRFNSSSFYLNSVKLVGVLRRLLDFLTIFTSCLALCTSSLYQGRLFLLPKPSLVSLEPLLLYTYWKYLQNLNTDYSSPLKYLFWLLFVKHCAILPSLQCSYGPRQANLVLIAYASSEDSGEPAHPSSLARTFAARSYKQWVKRNLQTESQIPGPSEWLGMRS